MNDDTHTTIEYFQLGSMSATPWKGHVSARSDVLDIPGIIDTLDSYYVPVAKGVKTRCIDGRHDADLDEDHLGPQVAGGAVGAALAYRLAVDKDDLTRGTFYADAEAMIEHYLRLGLSPGGHRDDTERETGVGCGAIDGIDTTLKCLTDPTLVEDHKRLTRAILDLSFNRDNYLRVMGAGLVLRSRDEQYFEGRDSVMDLLEEKAPKSVSTLRGSHNEKLVIVNFVKDTTMSSNRFAQEHEGVQAFGYDVWRSKQLAAMLLPLRSQLEDRERFITARVMITVATLMALTDGSQQVIVRMPVTNDRVDTLADKAGCCANCTDGCG